MVDVLDAMRLYARARKVNAISHMLIEDWKPFPVDKTYEANVNRAYGNAGVSTYSQMALLKENDERKAH